MQTTHLISSRMSHLLGGQGVLLEGTPPVPPVPLPSYDEAVGDAPIASSLRETSAEQEDMLKVLRWMEYQILFYYLQNVAAQYLVMKLWDILPEEEV